MAFSPLTQQVLAANNAETPAFGNLFSTNNGHPQVHLSVSPITVPANMGDPGRRLGAAGVEPQTTTMGGPSFWISVPQLAGANNPGGVAQISTAGQVLQTKDFGTLAGISSAGCAPAGLAVSASGNMLVGCSNPGTQAVLLDKNGNFLKFVGPGL
jgi:hypothetical protein